MAAVRAATIELLAERSPREVSVRDIAERAGVNHALAHRHFGSKHELLRAAIHHQSAEIAAAARGLPNRDAATALALLRRYPAYWRILARTVLDAPDLLPRGEFPAAQAFLDLLGGGTTADRRTPAAVAGALVLGWMVFGEHLATAVGEPDQARLTEAVTEAVRRLLPTEPTGRS
jgi:Transcriptional regulator